MGKLKGGTYIGGDLVVATKTYTNEICVFSGATTGYIMLCSGIDGGGKWMPFSYWTSLPNPIRTNNTTFQVDGNLTNMIAKGMLIKWTESSVIKLGMVQYTATNSLSTAVVIIGDIMSSIDAGSLKYSMLGGELFIKNFAIAGTIGSIGTNITNAMYALEPLRVIGADLQVGTAGTTNSTTIDINKNGATMFTVKPTLATTVASSPLPFTADNGTTLALGDKVTIDIDAIQTTPAIDLYIQLYLLPTRYLYL